MTRRRVRIDLAYDGTPFSGFARQPDRATVQGALEGALARVLGSEVAVTCAGRTDAGVHAMAQVVHLDVEDAAQQNSRTGVDQDERRHTRWLQLVAEHPDSARRRLDRMVGGAITIWRVAAVPSDFDARFSAIQRAYRYRLVDREADDPRMRNLRWATGEALHVPSMRAAATHLLGEHDFTSLCRRAPGRHRRRRLDRLTIARRDDEIQVALRGPAFCHQQVRSIMGCLVEVGAGREHPDWMGQVLAARDRSVAARVAPPQGLTLERVGYGRRWPAAPPVDVAT